MSYKDLLVVLSPEAKSVGPYAASVASAFGARVKAACVVADPVVPSYVIPEMPSEILENARASARVEAETALNAFASTAKEAGVESHSLVIQGMLDSSAGEVTRLARYADLAIVEQPGTDSDHGEEIVLETLLFGSGRPLLIVPYIQRKPFTVDNVIIAWDGGATASRAVAAAMPAIERAKRVEVVSVGEGGRADREDGEMLARYLEGHGVRAQGKWLNSVGDVTDTILSHAADTGADLVVMGGYGHSRLREFILGGATRGMLRTMTVPVLMMH